MERKGKRKMLDKTNLLTLYIYYIKNFNICQFFSWGKAIRPPPRRGLGLWRNLTLIIKRGKILTFSIYIEN